MVLPLVLVATPVLAVCRWCRPPWYVLAVAGGACLLAVAGLAWGPVGQGRGATVWVTGYAAVQLDTGAALVAAWPAVDWPKMLLAYGSAIWPYALTGGPLLALMGEVWLRTRGRSADRTPPVREEHTAPPAFPLRVERLAAAGRVEHIASRR